MDIYSRKLYKAVVTKAHVGSGNYGVDMSILILAKDFDAARKILVRDVRGYKRKLPYSLEEIEFESFFKLEKKYKRILFTCGYLYLDRKNSDNIKI